ncbi:MAG: translational GTPase TypA [Thermaerobacterales bacterium]
MSDQPVTEATTKSTAAKLRNVAIIAHVDHGKTTLVDAILKQTGIFGSHQQVADRVMDQSDIERERGITILSKNTAVHYKGHKINIVDTPGHADFGGEVERILGMVDGALLIVDAAEGPMPQTRFVLTKAFSYGLQPIVVINKIDRQDARPDEVIDEVLDLFIDLGAEEDSIDFPIVYANARDGKAGKLQDPDTHEDILPVLDAILEYVPAPAADADKSLQFQVSALDYDSYVGRLAIGRARQGRMRVGDKAIIQHGPEDKPRPVTITALFGYTGLERHKVDLIEAGDIGAIAGIDELTIGDTVTDPDNPQALPPITVEAPTLQMTFLVNSSPFAGREGKYLTSRHIWARLQHEAQKDVSLLVEQDGAPDRFLVSGRGELHLSIIIETMRREGYELAVEQPRVIERVIDDKIEEPIEVLWAEVPEDSVGAVIEKLGPRQAKIMELTPAGSGRMRLKAEVPTRGLLGFRPMFMTATRGEGIMVHVFDRFDVKRGEMPGRVSGAMIAFETGATTAHAIENAVQRGVLFVGPGEEVYKGQIVGECARPQDLEINICRKRKVTNMRSSISEEQTRLTPPRRLSLEEAITWIGDGEQVEITPTALRLRKA